MKKLKLIALAVCLHVCAHAQKAKGIPIQTETKTFLVSETTAKSLPDGVTYKNNKLTISKNIPYIKAADGKSIVCRPNNGTYKFTCECAAGSVGSCNWEVVDAPDVLECTGSCTCIKTVTVTTPPIQSKNLKIN